MGLKRHLLIVVIIIIAISCFAKDLTEEEYNKNYKDEMNVILHYATGFRFGTNLKVGDYVEYKSTKNTGYDIHVTLEVTKKSEKGIWIIEKFDGNEVHMLFDPVKKKLLKIWGYDKKKNYQEYLPIKEEIIENRLPKIKQQVKEGTFSDSITQTINNKQIKTKAGSFNCSVFTPSYRLGNSPKDISSKVSKKMQQMNKIYFSENVPKLYPFLSLATSLIGREDAIKNSNDGFVKNNVVELVKVKKGEK